MSLSTEDLDFVRALVRERSAIVLEREKAYLVEARLQPLARREGYESLPALVTALRRQAYQGLPDRVVDAMTTNETSWFRDVRPFEALRTSVLPDLIERRRPQRSLRIWCAASSSGQEPYSILMVIRHYFPELVNWDIRILATDISVEMLDRTRTGVYSQLEVNRGLPAQMLVRFFEKDGLNWRVKQTLRDDVDVRQLNLATAWPALSDMDVVFLRNVLIYFDLETKRHILGKVRRIIRPDGYLFLGGAETTLNVDEAFGRHDRAVSGCYTLRLVTSTA